MDNREEKNLFEEIYQKAFDTKFLDVEDDEKTVRNNLDFIENKISSRKDTFVSLTLYPSIAVVKKFLDKWKATPIYEGKKWIVVTSSDPYSKGVEMDLDIYDDAFSWCRLCDKSFNFYESKFIDCDISPQNYQYSEFLKENKKDNNHKVLLKSFDNTELIEEIKSRAFSPKEIKEIIDILE